jgi:phosphoribosylformylglycinamidine cyclo-ligase
MGHRFEIYIDETYANDIIAISESFGVKAKIIGKVLPAEQKTLTIESQFGNFEY